MVAVPLIFGRLTTEDYSDAVAADPRIDALREKVGYYDLTAVSCVTVLTYDLLCNTDGVRGG